MSRTNLNARFLLLLVPLLALGPVGSYAQDDADVQADILVKSTASWNGERLPPYPAGQPEVTVVKIKIPPGKALPFHRHPVMNVGYLLKGTLTVETDDGKILHLKAGDAAVEVVGRWHRGRNEGTETAEILVVYAGLAGTPVTVEK